MSISTDPACKCTSCITTTSTYRTAETNILECTNRPEQSHSWECIWQVTSDLPLVSVTTCVVIGIPLWLAEMKVLLAVLAILLVRNCCVALRSPSGPVKHYIVLMMENRAYDHMLGWFQMEDAHLQGLTGAEYNLWDPQDPSSKVFPVNKDAQDVRLLYSRSTLIVHLISTRITMLHRHEPLTQCVTSSPIPPRFLPTLITA